VLTSVLRLPVLAATMAMGLSVMGSSAAAVPPDPDPVPLVEVSAGAAAIFNSHERLIRGGIEYIAEPFWGQWAIRPGLGFSYFEEGSNYVYISFNRDFPLGRHWLWRLTTGAGYYHESLELNLGCGIEFRSGLELAYRFDNGLRLGASLHHMSNADSCTHNPGTEIVSAAFSFPIGRAASASRTD